MRGTGDRIDHQKIYITVNTKKTRNQSRYMYGSALGIFCLIVCLFFFFTLEDTILHV